LEFWTLFSLSVANLVLTDLDFSFIF